MVSLDSKRTEEFLTVYLHTSEEIQPPRDVQQDVHDKILFFVY